MTFVPQTFAVVLDMTNPDQLYDVLYRFPGVTARAAHGAGAWPPGTMPAFTFTGSLNDLVNMIRTDWEDGTGEELNAYTFSIE